MKNPKKTYKNTQDYKGQWDSFWKAIRHTGTNGQVLWDNVPELASAEDLRRFKCHMSTNIPLVDIGCGNGRQTRFLAKHFNKTIGVDISPAAIKLAREETVDEKNVEYRLIDTMNTTEINALHKEFGDMNIYMRGVLHFIQEPDRPKFISNLAILLGETGILYQIELTPGALFYFRSLPRDNESNESGFPELVYNVVKHDLHSIGFNLKDRDIYYPENVWSIIEQGNAIIKTIPLSDGKDITMSANYLILKTKRINRSVKL